MKGDIKAAEKLLEIYLDREDVKIINLEVQSFQPMLESRSGIYDLLAETKDEIIIVEVQDRMRGDEWDRSRYYNALNDVGSVLRGQPFNMLKKLTILVLVGGDVLGKNMPVYTSRMYVEETGEFNDKLGITHVFVNIDMCEGDSAIAKANHDLRCDNVEDMNYNFFAKLYSKGQNRKAGVKTMCDLIQKLIEEERIEAIAEGKAEAYAEVKEKMARKMLEDGYLPHENISRYTELPLAKVNSIAASMGM